MMKILSLGDFAPPAPDDKATVSLVGGCAKHCDRASLIKETRQLGTLLRDHPDLSVSPDMLATRDSGLTIGARDMFLPVHESALKRIASVWREKGFVEAVRATADEDPEQVTRTLYWIALRLKKLFDLVEKVASRNEGPPTSGSGSVADVAATRDWATAIVRCLSWHPQCLRLALATRDDRIRVYSKDVQGAAVLRHGFQKSVSCMCWRPNAGRELAAACQNGVLVWTVELGAASSSLSQAQILKQRGQAPVTNVAWHPQGDLLVSCSPADSNMYIWDVSKESGVPLKRVGGGGLCLARWSHCGSRLLAATSRSIFRVWTANDGTAWKPERWTVPNGRVAAACFGPNLTLQFASTENPATIFSLPLQENIFDVKNTGSADDVKAAVPLIDLTSVQLDLEDDERQGCSVGGRVSSMDWDPSGKYLAVIFQNSPIVAIFETKLRSTSRVAEAFPGCLVKGFSREVPNCMHFQQNYGRNSEPEGACLTIAWSSGRVQHFPIISQKSSDLSQDRDLNSSSFARGNDSQNIARYGFSDSYYSF